MTRHFQQSILPSSHRNRWKSGSGGQETGDHLVRPFALPGKKKRNCIRNFFFFSCFSCRRIRLRGVRICRFALFVLDVICRVMRILIRQWPNSRGTDKWADFGLIAVLFLPNNYKKSVNSLSKFSGLSFL